MTSYYVEIVFELGPHADEQGFEAHLDKVAEALTETPDVDGDLAADLSTGRVEFCITVDADDRQEAFLRAIVAARSAVHGAGGMTGSWDGWIPKLLDSDEYRSTVAPSSLAS